MATATITVTDIGEGKIDVHIEFTPAASNNSESVAQSTAIRFIEMLKHEAGPGGYQGEEVTRG